MPDIPQEFGYLLALFFDSGQAMSTGMGLTPLNWQEIESWINVNNLELSLWEIETIKKMSEAYCAEYSRASDPMRQAPYQIEQKIEEVEDDEEKLAMLEEQAMRQALAWRNALNNAAKGK